MADEKGENAEISLGEVADIKMTLKIWDVPPELGRKFIGMAKSSYANKSWLLLQDLMIKADKYDTMVSSGRLAEIERQQAAFNGRLTAIETAIEKVGQEMEASGEEPEEDTKAKKPKTFGGTDG